MGFTLELSVHPTKTKLEYKQVPCLKYFTRDAEVKVPVKVLKISACCGDSNENQSEKV